MNFHYNTNISNLCKLFKNSKSAQYAVKMHSMQIYYFNIVIKDTFNMILDKIQQIHKIMHIVQTSKKNTGE